MSDFSIGAIVYRNAENGRIPPDEQNGDVRFRLSAVLRRKRANGGKVRDPVIALMEMLRGARMAAMRKLRGGVGELGEGRVRAGK